MFDILFCKQFYSGRSYKQKMEKQKLAQMVMEKMRQKKEQEERNRPHFEVLRLEALFSKELNTELKGSIAQLQEMLEKERKRLQELQSHLNEVDNTGKKSLPRIVVMPEFIASENVAADAKEFYRKSSNSFLRTDILRSKGYEESMQKQRNFLESLAAVRELEATIAKNRQEDRTILNEKRVKVLKEDLRLRAIREQQKRLKQTMEQEKEQRRDLLNEYEIKKVNLQSRKDRLKYVCEQIELYKAKIEQAFNPISYREHLKNVFAVQIKNQIMHSSLVNVSQKVQQLDRTTKIFEKQLEKTSSLLVLGRTSDSPANKLGKIKNRLEQQRKRKSLVSSLEKRSGMSSQRSLQSSPQKSRMTLDFSTIAQSSGKTSIGTTDRSSLRRPASSISRTLF